MTKALITVSDIKQEANKAANLIYNGQAILRMVAAVIDPDNGVQFDSHTAWRALQAADAAFDEAAAMADRIESWPGSDEVANG